MRFAPHFAVVLLLTALVSGCAEEVTAPESSAPGRPRQSGGYIGIGTRSEADSTNVQGPQANATAPAQVLPAL